MTKEIAKYIFNLQFHLTNAEYEKNKDWSIKNIPYDVEDKRWWGAYNDLWVNKTEGDKLEHFESILKEQVQEYRMNKGTFFDGDDLFLEAIELIYPQWFL